MTTSRLTKKGCVDRLRSQSFPVIRSLTPDQPTQAEQMARDWKSGYCPSAEHRLGDAWGEIGVQE